MEADPRDRLHRLVDHLPKAEVRAAERNLDYLSECGDPLVRIAMAASEEDRPTRAPRR